MTSYERVLILGLGWSGDAAARLLLAEGADVEVIDQSDTQELRERAGSLAALGARVRLGQSELPSSRVSVCVVSPGVPATSPWVRIIRKRRIPVISELELGWSRVQCRVLAVTGSNGKSTLAKLCAESLAQAGLKVAIAGNYEANESAGIPARALPVSRVVADSKALDWLVLEVSSFQLETVSEFRPDVGVLLNVFPNHLDRHGDLLSYEQLKFRLFSRMRNRDVGIVPEDMMAGGKMSAVESGLTSWVSFGLSPGSMFRYHEGCVVLAESSSVSLAGTMFDNRVLGLTAAAAVAAIGACGAPADHVGSAARAFKSLPHRMQDVGTLSGIRCIDDSKATNVAAMNAALSVTRGRVRLIAGGKPKNDEYEPARRLLAERVVGVYLIGEAADAMSAAWQSVARCVMSRTLEQAVLDAMGDARPGETILLSPGCASFDQFHDFDERGNRFVECLRAFERG